MSDDDLYRKKSGLFGNIQNVLVGILVGMLVLAFAVWGIEDVFSPNSSNAVVRVGDAEIGRTEFTDRYNDRMREFARENGEGLTNQQAFDRGIPQQLVQQIQQELAIEADAADLGVSVNNRDVRRYVENIEAFRNEITGEFDELQLRQILSSNQIRQGDFEQDIVNALTQRQTLPAIMGGIEAPNDYARRFNSFVNEVRTASLLRIGEGQIDPIGEPSDADLESYIAANVSRFTSPEYRRLLMIRLEPFDFEQDIEISDEAIRERFDTLVAVGELGAVETRDIAVITAPTEAQATAAAARISAGETPEAVATDLSLPSPDLFPAIKENGLINPASSTVAFEAEQGEARVAPTEFGTFEVVVVQTVNAAETPDFDAVREELRADVLDGEARSRIADYERIIDDMLLEGATIEEIAEEIDVPISSYPYIDRSGTTRDGIRLSGFSRIPGLATDPILLGAIFSSDIGFESDITPTSNEGLAIFRVTDIIEAEAKPLEDVREDAVSGWTAEALNDALVSKGVELNSRLRAGEDLDAIAASLGLETETLVIRRASPPQTVSPSVTVGLLDADIGDVARGAGAQPDTYEIAVLQNISNSDDFVGGKLLDLLKQRVSEEIALDISRAYETAILTDKGAQVFDDQVRAALNLDATLQP